MGVAELLILLVLILLLFGASRLPALARSVSESRRELKRGAQGDDDEAAQ